MIYRFVKAWLGILLGAALMLSVIAPMVGAAWVIDAGHPVLGGALLFGWVSIVLAAALSGPQD